jgi:hypothetical protein
MLRLPWENCYRRVMDRQLLRDSAIENKPTLRPTLFAWLYKQRQHPSD